MNRTWLLVILAGVVEVIWAVGLKYADSLLAWGGTVLLIFLSFVMLIQSTKTLPVATVYAVFTGIGTAGTVLVGMTVFGEPFSWIKIFFLLLLIFGILGLKLVTGEKEEREGAV
ncbi:MAG: DMT family transporter [Bacillus sp. (in: firmicutes)]